MFGKVLADTGKPADNGSQSEYCRIGIISTGANSNLNECLYSQGAYTYGVLLNRSVLLVCAVLANCYTISMTAVLMGSVLEHLVCLSIC